MVSRVPHPREWNAATIRVGKVSILLSMSDQRTIWAHEHNLADVVDDARPLREVTRLRTQKGNMDRLSRW
jgi:hypothetical protein